MNLYGYLGVAASPNATVSGGEWICQADGFSVVICERVEAGWGRIIGFKWGD